jgi:hypothetical protein
MGVAVTYTLVGRGWADCTVEVDGRAAHLTASYLSDALGDLIRSMSDLLRGDAESTVSFADEPGEYRWRLKRHPPDRVALRITRLTRWGSGEDGEVVLKGECRLRTLAGAVLAAAQQVIREHGEEGYLRIWVNHPFPVEQHAELKRLLEKP